MRTILTAQSPAKKLTVVECPPAVRTILLSAGNVHRQFRLAFPHVVFAFREFAFSEPMLGAFWRTSPLVTIQDEIYPMTMPNVRYMDGLACCPPGASPEDAVTKFWSSAFTDDWYSGVLMAMDKIPRKTTKGEVPGIILDYFLKWESETAAGEVKWPFQRPTTLEAYLKIERRCGELNEIEIHLR